MSKSSLRIPRNERSLGRGIRTVALLAITAVVGSVLVRAAMPEATAAARDAAAPAAPAAPKQAAAITNAAGSTGAVKNGDAMQTSATLDLPPACTNLFFDVVQGPAFCIPDGQYSAGSTIRGGTITATGTPPGNPGYDQANVCGDLACTYWAFGIRPITPDLEITSGCVGAAGQESPGTRTRVPPEPTCTAKVSDTVGLKSPGAWVGLQYYQWFSIGHSPSAKVFLFKVDPELFQVTFTATRRPAVAYIVKNGANPLGTQCVNEPQWDTNWLPNRQLPDCIRRSFTGTNGSFSSAGYLPAGSYTVFPLTSATTGSVRAAGALSTFPPKSFTVSSDDLTIPLKVGVSASFDYEAVTGPTPRQFTFTSTTQTAPGVTNVDLLWDFHDGSPTVDNQQVVTHQFPRAGVFNVTLTATSGSDTDTAARDVTVDGPTELTVTVNPDPAEFELDEDVDGPKPRDVTVTVDVKNPAAVPVDGVSVDLKPTLLTQSGKPLEPFPIDVTQTATPSDQLGTIQPGATKTITYKLKVTDDVAAKIHVFAVGTNRSGQRADGIGEANLDAKPKYDVYFEAQPEDQKLRGSNPFLFAGEQFSITMKVRNLTTEKKIFLLPLVPEMHNTGVNTGGGIPHDISKFSADDVGAPPFGGDLPANRSTSELLRTTVVTQKTSQEVKGFVGLAYKPNAVVIDEVDGTRTAVPASRVLIKDGSGPYQFRIEPPLDYPDTSLLNAAWGLTVSFGFRTIEVVASLCQGLWWATSWVASHAGEVTVDAVVPGASMLRTMEQTTRWWNALDDTRRADLVGSLIVDMERQYGEPVTNVKNAINAAVYDWFARQDDAVKRGDSVAIANTTGEFFADVGVGGPGIDAAIARTAKELAVARLAQQALRNDAAIAQALATKQAQLEARMPSLLSDFRLATSSTDSAATAAQRVEFARRLETGEELGESVVSELFRTGTGQQGLFKKLAKDYKLSITVPASQPFTGMSHLESLNILPVDGIDTLFLGFRREDVGALVIGEGLAESEIVRLTTNVRAAFGDDIATIVAERARLRRAEAATKQAILNQYAANGGIPLMSGTGEKARISLQQFAGQAPFGFAAQENINVLRIGSQVTGPAGGGAVTVIDQTIRPAQVATELLDVRMADGMALPQQVRVDVLREILKTQLIADQDLLLPFIAKVDTALNPSQKALVFDLGLGGTGPSPAAAQFGADGLVRAVRVNTSASVLEKTAQNYVHYVGNLVVGEQVVGKSAGAVLPPKTYTGPLLQAIPTKVNDDRVSFAPTDVPPAGTDLVIDPNTPTEETVRIVAPAAAAIAKTATARSRAASLTTSAVVDPVTGLVTVQVTAPMRFDHPIGAIWVPSAQVVRPDESSTSTSTTTTSTSTTSTTTTSTTTTSTTTPTTSTSTSTTTTSFTSTSAPTSTSTTTSTVPTSGGDGERLYDDTVAPPSTLAIGATYAVETGQRVRFNCTGTVTGLWWYRTVSDTGTNTVSLWDGNSLLGRGAADPGKAGWVFVPFTTAVSVSAGQTLLASVHRPNGAYAYRLNGFTNRSVASRGGCLTSPASAPGAKNGMYAYRVTPAAPDLSYGDSEYFISPAFQTSSPTTTTPVEVPKDAADRLYAASVVPPDRLAIGSQYAVETGQRVRFNCVGAVTGMWWYRTADDTGINTVSLWRGSTLVARGAADPRATGWVYVAFASPVAVASGETLLASVHHPNGAYGYRLNGFAGRSITSGGGCMTAVPTAAGEPNGRYSYTPLPAMPTLSYAASEYFVSPAFVRATG